MKRIKNKSLFFLSIFLLLISEGMTQSYRTTGLDTLPKVPKSPRYKTNITAPLPSNKWWTSIFIKQLSDGIVPLPLIFFFKKEDASRYGLCVYYGGYGELTDSSTVEYTGSQADLWLYATNIHTNNLTAKVSGYGDWSVKAVLSDTAVKKMEVYIVKGSPFCYAEFNDGDSVRVYFQTRPEKYFDDSYNTISDLAGTKYTNDHIGVRLRYNKYYAIYCPPDSVFSNINARYMAIKLGNNENYLSIALLTEINDLQDYYPHAYAFITNTRVSWNYDAAQQKVITAFNALVDLKRPGFSSDPVLGLFPHQWKYSFAVAGPEYYDSVRGKIKVYQGNSFTTEHDFRGIVPHFNEPQWSSTYSQATQINYFTVYTNVINIFSPFINDTYGQGKHLINMAQGMMQADEIGQTEIKTFFSNNLMTVLEDWYNYTDGEPRHYYAYFNDDPGATNDWGTMIGYDLSYFTEDICDHHFHNGYYLFASAVMALYNPQFKAQYQGMIEHLIRDINCPDRNDPMYPFLRYFDVYEGHCWAGGYADNQAGSNQESSSESMNAWAGIYLWGLVTGNDTYRDLGIWGYTVERIATEQYYFNIDGDNWHPDFHKAIIDLLFGASYKYGVYFSGEPENHFGIHWLPTSPVITYLGYDQALAQNMYDAMVLENGGPEDGWYHIIWAYQSLFDPQAVLAKWDANKIITDDNEEELFNTYWFVHNMNSMGHPVTDTWAYNWPSYQVFNKAGTNTYVVFNPTGVSQEVAFVNGQGTLGKLSVAPYTTVTSRLLDPDITETMDHFEIIHDGQAVVSVNERIIIQAMDQYHTVMTGYTGVATLYVDPGTNSNVFWETNSAGNNGFFSNLNYGRAVYTFTSADKGIVTLQVRDISIETIDPECRDNSSHLDNDHFPQYISITDPLVLDHFEIIHDGLAIINYPESVAIRAVDNQGETLTNWAGTVTLFVEPGYSGNIEWHSNTAGGHGSFTNLGNARALYTFIPADKGIITLSIANDTVEYIDPGVKDSSNHLETNSIPQFLEFREPGFKIYVDQANTYGPWDGKYWTTAFKTINDALMDFSEGFDNEIIIAGGDYKEEVIVDFWHSGTPGHTNKIYGFTNAVFINGENIRETCVKITGNAAYILLENLILTGAFKNGLHLFVTRSNIINRVVSCRNGESGITLQGATGNAIYNCTFWSNDSAGIFLASDSTNNIVENCIVQQNLWGGILGPGLNNTYDYNNVYANAGNNYDIGITPGINSISMDSLFAITDPAHPEFLHLSGISPCVDTGDPAFPVPAGGGLQIDMGAYEFNAGSCSNVTITGFSPSECCAQGGLITVYGTGFQNIQGAGFVKIGSTRVQAYNSWYNTRIEFIAPEGINSNPVSVTNYCGNGDTTSSNLYVPVIMVSGFSPAYGCPGTSVSISGQGFGSSQGDGYVKFSNTLAGIDTWQDNLIEVTVPASGGPITVQNSCGSNIIQYTPLSAAASSTEGTYTADLALDNNNATRWGSEHGTDPQWLCLDLGEDKYFNRLILEWQTAYSRVYRIEISSDFNDWQTVLSNTNASGLQDHWLQTNDFNTVRARYVRLFSIERATGWGVSLWEMSVFARNRLTISSNFMIPQPEIICFYPEQACPGEEITVYGQEFEDSQGNGQVLFNGQTAAIISWSDTLIRAVFPENGFGPVTVENDCGQSSSSVLNSPVNHEGESTEASSTNGADLPDYIFDNNNGTRWDSAHGSDPQWIILDLGGNRYFNRSVIEWENAYSRDYSIHVSTNLQDWLTVASNTNQGGLPNHWQQTNDFYLNFARYIRLVSYERINTLYGVSLFEMDIWLDRDSEVTQAVPVLLGFSPSSGSVDDPVNIYGTGFGQAQLDSQVFFGNAAVLVYNTWSSTNIQVLVPPGAPTGPLNIVNTCGLSNMTLSNFSVVTSAVSLHHFEIEHDGQAIVDIYEPVIISAINTLGVIMTNWTGIVTLDVLAGAAGFISWSTNTNGNYGLLTNTVNAQALYTFMAMDQGLVTLRIIDDTAESIDLTARDTSNHYEINIEPRWLEVIRTNHPHMQIEKQIDNFTVNMEEVPVLPGCTVNYSIFYTNDSLVNVTYVKLYDQQNYYITYCTQISPTSWTCEWATNNSPDTNWSSADFMPVLPVKDKITWVRWKKGIVLPDESGIIYYRVIIK